MNIFLVSLILGVIFFVY